MLKNKNSPVSSDLQSQSESEVKFSRQLELCKVMISNKTIKRIATVWWYVVLIHPGTVDCWLCGKTLSHCIFSNDSTTSRATSVSEIITKQTDILQGFYTGGQLTFGYLLWKVVVSLSSIIPRPNGLSLFVKLNSLFIVHFIPTMQLDPSWANL